MLPKTTYVPEILTAFAAAKDKESKKKVLLDAVRAYPQFKTILIHTYSEGKKPRLNKKAIDKLLKAKYRVPYAPHLGMADSHLYIECKKLPLFFEGSAKLTEEKLGVFFVRIREVLHPAEFDVFVNILLQKNLAKGLTEQLITETFPNLIAKQEK